MYLTGAGPGDPSLLTQKAVEVLGRADLVAYDDLVHPEMLNLASPGAEFLGVGYRHGTPRGVLGGLHDRVIQVASEGGTVVRLKAGDPMVLARGGEEALGLFKLGIPFEIIPGITAALGAASYAGIPLTHRGMSLGFSLMTGHVCKSSSSSLTQVFYMVRQRLRQAIDDLLSHGYRKETPAAFVVSASSRGQRVVDGCLDDIEDKIKEIPTGAPGLLVVGDVVSLRHELAWFNTGLPLSGYRVMIGRARPGPSTIAKELQGLGADVVQVPQVRVQPLQGEAFKSFCGEIGRQENFDAIAFGSTSGVRAYVEAIGSLEMDLRYVPKISILALGRGVRDELRRYGLVAEGSTEGSCLAELSALQSNLMGRKVLLLTSTGGRPNLRRDMIALGAEVSEVAAYGYKYRYPRVVSPPPDLVVGPSSSSVKALFREDLGFDLKKTTMAVMGPDSESYAQSAGVEHLLKPNRDGVKDLVGIILRFFQEKGLS